MFEMNFNLLGFFSRLLYCEWRTCSLVCEKNFDPKKYLKKLKKNLS